MQAPPIGLMPRHLYDERAISKTEPELCERVQRIREAVQRYVEAGVEVPAEWMGELEDRRVQLLAFTEKRLTEIALQPTPLTVTIEGGGCKFPHSMQWEFAAIVDKGDIARVLEYLRIARQPENLQNSVPDVIARGGDANPV